MSLSGRGAFFREACTPRALLAAGGAVMAAFLLQPHTGIRLGMAAVFLGMAWLKGRRIRPGLVFFFVVSLAAVHQLTPHGRVLFTAGPFLLTRGALDVGLRKAGLLIGLMYLSQFSLDSRLQFPGRMGALLGRSFFYLERLLEFRGHISRRRLIHDLDQLLLDIQGGGEMEGREGRREDQPGGTSQASGTASSAGGSFPPARTAWTGWLFLLSWTAAAYAGLAAGLALTGGP